MTFLGEVVAWLADPVHWAGTDGIPTRVGEHVELSALALAAAAVIALPIGIALGHSGRGGFVAINVANIGRALPSLAILAFALPVAFALNLGLGFWPTFIALVPLGIPPILTNAFVALRNVDRDVIEAGRGMGLAESQLLRQLELPLALPVVIAGVRNAAVAIVATATLGAVVASGGLGRYIVDGIANRNFVEVFAGAVLVALLAAAAEIGLAVLQYALTPAGLRSRIKQERQAAVSIQAQAEPAR